MTGYSPGSEVLTTLNRLSVTRSWNFGSTWANGDFSRNVQHRRWFVILDLFLRTRTGKSSVTYCGGWWIRHPIWRTELDVSTTHRSRSWSSLHTTDKPLSEPIVVSLPTQICVTRPQWVKSPRDIPHYHALSVKERRRILRKISTRELWRLNEWRLYIR